MIVINKDTCVDYELYAAYPQAGGSRWHAGSGAIFNLRSNHLRPAGWTSADAAGLPIFPGLARYDEVARGTIDHALRFTVERTRNTYVYPRGTRPPRTPTRRCRPWDSGCGSRRASTSRVSPVRRGSLRGRSSATG